MIARVERYTQRITALNPSLFLRLDETGGVDALDYSGNGTNGVYSDVTLAVREGPIRVEEKLAPLFSNTTGPDTNDSNVQAAGVEALGTAWTLEAWVYVTSLGGIFLSGSLPYLNAAGGLSWQDTSPAQRTLAFPALTTGVWHHVVGTHDGTTASVYVDGVLVASTSTWDTGAVGSTTWWFGAHVNTTGASFAGYLQYAALYPSALTLAQVRGNYMLGREIFSECPVYGVHIQNADGSGPDYRFVTATVSPTAPWVDAPAILVEGEITHKVDPRECRFEAPECSFTLLDFDGQATAVINDIVGKQCVLYTLDYSTDWSNDGVALFTGIVREFSLVDKAYNVIAQGPIVLADRNLFNSGRTKVETAIDADDTAVVVEDASGFDDSGVIIIDTERIAYASVTDNGTNWTLGGLTRGHLGSTAASHDIGAAVVETFILGPDHPFDILLDLLDGDADTKTGLGMSAYSDFVNYINQKLVVGESLEMFFEVQGPHNAKDWIERELLLPMATYPRDNNIGDLLIKAFSTAGATVSTIADEHSLARATWVGNFPLRVNHVTYLYDWDTERFNSARVVKDDGLIAEYGMHPIVIESKGIHSDLTDFDVLMDERGAAFIERFGLELPTIHVPTLFRKRYLEAGDDVATTFSHLVNVSAGEIGLSDAPAEIITVKHHLRDGRMDFTLISHQPIFDALVPDAPAFGLTATPEVTIA